MPWKHLIPRKLKEHNLFLITQVTWSWLWQLGSWRKLTPRAISVKKLEWGILLAGSGSGRRKKLDCNSLNGGLYWCHKEPWSYDDPFILCWVRIKGKTHVCHCMQTTSVRESGFLQLSNPQRGCQLRLSITSTPHSWENSPSFLKGNVRGALQHPQQCPITDPLLRN